MTTTLDPLVALRRHAASAPWAVAELAELADRLLGASGDANDRPTSERTVRFWVARGAVGAPFGRGPGTAWGYPHLVELLAVRLAQRAGEPLTAVARRRETLAPEALEAWVAGTLGVAVPPPADPPQPVDLPPAPARRIAVAPGVELHVAGSHPLAADLRRLDAVVDRLARDVAPRTQETR